MKKTTEEAWAFHKLVGERLQACRLEHGWDQEFVANHMDVAKTAISSYERGIHDCGIYRIVKFAELYEVSIEWILGQ